MSQTVTVSAGKQTSPLISADVGSLVTLTPAGTAYVEYTTASLADARNGTATWLTWPNGSVTSASSDTTYYPLILRVQVTSGTATLQVNDPVTQVGNNSAIPWKSRNPTYSTGATGSVTGLAALPNMAQYTTDTGGNVNGLNVSGNTIPLPIQGTPYLGQVATLKMCANTILTVGILAQQMVRTPTVARDRITTIQLMYPNWYLPVGQTETGSGGTVTITAAIEYPIGTTCTRVTWSGSASTVVASNTNSALSDACAVSIPRGARFMIRTYAVWSVNSLYYDNNSSAGDAAQSINGGSFRYAITGLTDQTMTPGATSGGNLDNTKYYGPIVAAGWTSRPSVLCLGDSRQEGFYDRYTGSGDVGEAARSVGPYFAYTNVGHASESAANFVNNTHTNRVAIAPYFSHVVSNYGINDVTLGGATAAATYANLLTIKGYFPSQKFFQLTLPPETTSTDSWATTGAQTKVNATNDIKRVAFNELVRSNANTDGYFDLCPNSETAYASGLWVVSPQGRVVTDAAANNSTTLTSASAAFTQADTGRVLVCAAMGFTEAVRATMTFVNATTVTMSQASTGGALTGQTASIGAIRYVQDGVHETSDGNIAYLTAQVIPPAAFTQSIT